MFDYVWRWLQRNLLSLANMDWAFAVLLVVVVEVLFVCLFVLKGVSVSLCCCFGTRLVGCLCLLTDKSVELILKMVRHY